MSRPADLVRRAVDVTAGAAGLILTAPILGAAALAVRLTMGPGVLFRQRRSGLGGQPFDVLKLRTMRHPAPGREAPEFDAERLTRLGRVLRSTSIDELPSLVNLVSGDITLVGPRPLPVGYLNRFTADERRRLEVKPGITGLAVINGRNDTTWEQRLAWDVRYVDSRTLAGDAGILLRTIPMLIRRRGISQPGSATMRELPEHR